MDIQTLTIKLAAEVAEFISKIKGVESLVTSAAQRMRDSFSGVWTTLGASVSVAGLGLFVKAAINAADQLDELSQRYGISAKELSGLQLAFKQAGVDTDGMASSMGKLQRAMADGNQGLAAIGVSTRNTDGSMRSTSSVLLDVADKFSELHDGAAKTALAVEIFGKSGADIVPLLNGGSDGIKDMITMAERLGLVIEDDVAAKMGNFNDTLELISMGAQGVGRGIATKLLPTLQSLAENFLTSMTSGDRLAKTAEFLANMLKGLYIGALAVVEVFSTLGKTFGSVIGAFFAAAQGNFKEAWAILKEGGADISKGWQETAAQISAAWSGAGGTTVAAFAAAGDAAKKHAPDLKAMEAGAKAAAKAQEEQRKEQEAQARLVAELAGVQGDYMLSLQRLQAQRDKGNVSEQQYVELVTALIAKQPMAKKLMDEHTAAEKEAAKATEAIIKAAESYSKQLDEIELAGASLLEQANERTRAVDEQVAATEFELTLMGKSNTERAIALKQYQIEVDLKKEIARINATIARQEDKDYAINAAKSAADKAKANAAAEVVNAEFERVSQQIEQSLTDALMRGFESGQGFAENFRNTISNMFRTLVLRPVVQAIVSPVAGAITGSLGLPGSANAGASALGMASNGLNIYNALGGAGAAYGTTAAANLVGAAGGDAMGALIAGNAGSWGVSAAGVTGAASAAGTIASAIPYIGAFVAIASLIKSLDDSGTYHTGGLGSYSSAGGPAVGDAVKGQGLGFDLASKDYTTSSQTAAAQMAQAVVGLLDSTAAAFGQQAGYYAATAFADDTSKSGAWGALMLKLGDQVLLDWKQGTDKWPGREFANGEAGAKEYAAAVALDVRDYLLTQTPDWADAMLSALGDAPTLEQLGQVVQQLGAVNDAIDAMGRASVAFAGISEAATTALVRQLGGADAAVANLGSYYAAYYTEAQRSAIVTQQITEQLADMGLQLPATRDAWKAMVDAAISSGDGGTAAALIRLSGAFASVTQSADDLAAAAKAQADEAARAAKAQADEAAKAAIDLAEKQAKAYESAMQSASAAMADADQCVKAFFDSFADSVADASSTLSGLSTDIRSYIDGLNAGTGTPTQDLAATRAAFDRQLALAKSGDRDAMGSITQYADRLISAGEQRLGNVQGAQLIAMVKTQLAALPAQVSAEQLIVDAIDRQTLANANALTTNFTRLDANVDGLLTFDELKAAGLATDGQIGNVIAALDANGDGMVSAMEAMTGTLASRFDAIDLDISGAINFGEFSSAFAGLGTESTLKSIFATLDADGDGQISRLEAIRGSSATTAENTYGLDKITRISDVINSLQWGTADADRASLNALATISGQQGWTAQDLSDAIANRFSASELMDFFGQYGQSIAMGGLGAYTAAGTAETGAIGGTKNPVTGGFVIGGATRPGFGGTTGAASSTAVGATRPAYSNTLGIAINDPSAIARLDSINSYVNTLDWGASSAAASAWETYQTAMQYGVSQQELAVSTGYSLADIQNLFDAAGVPRFASGGMHSGGLRLVGENGPELEVTGPARYINSADTMSLLRGGMPDFAAQYQAMAREFAAMTAKLAEANRLLSDISAASKANNTHTAMASNSLSTIVRDGVAVLGTGENVPAIKVEVVTP